MSEAFLFSNKIHMDEQEALIGVPYPSFYDCQNVQQRNGDHNEEIQDGQQNREGWENVLSLHSLLQWIKQVKGENVRMASLILATALKIEGPMTKMVCVLHKESQEMKYQGIETHAILLV